MLLGGYASCDVVVYEQLPSSSGSESKLTGYPIHVEHQR